MKRIFTLRATNGSCIALFESSLRTHHTSIVLGQVHMVRIQPGDEKRNFNNFLKISYLLTLERKELQ